MQVQEDFSGRTRFIIIIFSPSLEKKNDSSPAFAFSGTDDMMVTDPD